MCAIAGIMSFKNNLVELSNLQKMANIMQHRGNDGEGFWLNNSSTIGFAHKRLSIIDLSKNAAQPMHYLQHEATNKYTLIFNGEIYNYVELKKDLITKGYQFFTQSDTEVLLALYDCYQENCLQYLDGMFAFALWNNATQQLWIARDRFGEKPLYYNCSDEQFLFASEMKALWAVGVDKTINNARLLNYLSVGMVSNPSNAEETFYNSIKKLPAAHYLIINYNTKEISTKRYWQANLHEEKNLLKEEEVVEKFSYLFAQSIKRRLRSDVAVSTSLSGGLDSSSVIATITALNNKNNNEKPISFSAIFPGFAKDESAFINEVVNYFNLKNYTINPTAEGFVADFEKLLFHQEEPFQSSSIYTQFKVYELAKLHNIKVVLDGQGADEILAGYTKYYFWYWQSLLSNFKFSTLKKEKIAAKKNNQQIDWNSKNIAAAFFPNLAARKLTSNIKNKILFNPYIEKDFINANFNEQSVQKPTIKNLNQILQFNTCTNGLEDLLRYADRNAMAHGIEVRLPFLNHQLVEFVLNLPENYKIREGFTKYVLRTAMSNQLPQNIVWRKDKIGFEPPQKLWMENKKMEELLMQAKFNLAKAGILKKQVIDLKLTNTNAHEVNNYNWWFLCMGNLIG
ncbi:MAG TPA: asparagine synthase (glutamine-hydrolyzing) [Chitinophagaceae bacterium]|nr:asparagine synthase (glutamine-hydrolyzing) [Chitinophagaceae bacterium]MCC6635628.1 asparagine synthase (glutamine-hydrolyzing) [Chitinophagaceae bacterium]HMZ46666.1 asparagine synthase (glutamine-hydrolyzing) [Chitinophagaceae bacterium]HNE92617.1 asparagine synthase (glutamine-hydrolyzing) [Chitinophagaceae bacterium]HNF30249.1 asparagine synthase (glutamine-hydrolyzing) [Chitinophagaceae bacterium]